MTEDHLQEWWQADGFVLSEVMLKDFSRQVPARLDGHQFICDVMV